MRLRRGRFLFLIVLIGGIAAFTLLWYDAGGERTGTEPAFGGDYVEGIAGAPARINPLYAGLNPVDASLVALVFAGLTRLDDKGAPFPDLAETWSLSQDGRVYTFRLRAGLIWQDGAPITVDDVIFTYGLLKNSRTSHPAARVLSEATLAKIDARNLTLELPQPFAPLPAYLTLGILPSHLLRNQPPNALFDSPFNQQPVGAGPYRLESLSPERAILVASPGHHLGQPFVQRLEMRFYKDEGTLFTALRSRQVGGAVFRTPLAVTDRQQLEARKDLRLATLVTGETDLIFLNLRQSLFQDRRVRQALLHALDREALIRDVFAGQAVEPESPLGIDGWAYAPSLSRYSYDTNVAGLLLDEAGWRLNERGVRVRGGQELAFKLATNNDATRVAVAQAVAQRWAAIGVRATVEAGGATNLVRDLLEPRNFEAVLFGQVADADPDPYPAWHSSQASGKAANLSSLRDDRIDRLLTEARLVAAQPRRRELYAEFQELFAQEVPAIPLYTSAALYVQPAALQGTRMRLLISPGDRFWQVQEWHLKTR